MKVSFLIILLMSVGQAFSQDICFKVDSVTVCYIPWDYNPRFSLSKEDLLSGQYHHQVYTDSTIVHDLLIAQSFAKELPNENYSIDTRMLIQIYFKTHVSYILINSFGYYDFEGVCFERNDHLIDWVNTYVTQMR